MYYDKMLNQYAALMGKNIFRSTLQKFPAPNCVCFCNGLTGKPDQIDLNPEDAFLVPPAGKKRILFPVTMYNINAGHSSDLLNNCRRLAEYSWFIGRIRQYGNADRNTAQAVNEALHEMPESFLIRDCLLKNKAEVVEMCLTEYDEAWTLAQFKADGRTEEKHEMWMCMIRNYLNNAQGPQKDWLLTSLKISEPLFDRIADFLTRHSDLDDAAAAEQFPW